MNMTVGASQITGFAAGGLLVTLLTPTQTLLISAALEFAAALVVWLGLSRRPPRASGRPSVARRRGRATRGCGRPSRGGMSSWPCGSRTG